MGGERHYLSGGGRGEGDFEGDFRGNGAEEDQSSRTWGGGEENEE